MKVTLVHNPRAGSRRPTRAELESALEVAGHDVAYQSTREKGLEAAVQEAGDAVLVAGGDGTVRKVAVQLGTDVPMTVLPLGTANNYATTLGIDNDIDACLRRLAGGRRRSMDVGQCRGAWGDEHFVEGAGFGLVPELIRVVDKYSRAQPEYDPAAELAHARDVLASLAALLPAFDAELRFDDRVVEERLVLLEVMNAARVGPRLELAPAADPGDGEFAVVWVEESRRGELERAAEAWARGEAAAVPGEVVTTSSLEIRCNAGVAHVDDELWKPKRKQVGEGYEVGATCRAGAFNLLV